MATLRYILLMVTIIVSIGRVARCQPTHIRSTSKPPIATMDGRTFDGLLSTQPSSATSFEADTRRLLEQLITAVNDIRQRQQLYEQEHLRLNSSLELVDNQRQQDYRNFVREFNVTQQMLQRQQELQIANLVAAINSSNERQVDRLKQLQVNIEEQVSTKLETMVSNSTQQQSQLHIDILDRVEQIQEAVRNVAAKQSDSLSQLQMFPLNLSSEVTGLKQERQIANLVAAINSSDERQVDRLKQLQINIEEQVSTKLETMASNSTQQQSQQHIDILDRVEQIQEAVRNVAAKQSDSLSQLQMFQLNLSSEVTGLKQERKIANLVAAINSSDERQVDRLKQLQINIEEQVSTKLETMASNSAQQQSQQHIDILDRVKQIQEAVRNVAAKQSDSLSQLQMFQLNLSSEDTGLKQELQIANLVAAINSSDERQVDRLKQLQINIEEQVSTKLETMASNSTQQQSQQHIDILDRVEQIQEAVRNVAAKQSDSLSQLQMFQLNLSSEVTGLKQERQIANLVAAISSSDERQVDRLKQLQINIEEQVSTKLETMASNSTQQQSQQHIDILDRVEQIQEAVRNVAAKQSDSLSQLQMFQLNLSSEVTGLKQERQIANLVAAINSSDERKVDRLKQLQINIEEQVSTKLEIMASNSTQQQSQQHIDILDRVEQIQEAVRNVAAKQSDCVSQLQMFQLNLSSEVTGLKQERQIANLVAAIKSSDERQVDRLKQLQINIEEQVSTKLETMASNSTQQQSQQHIDILDRVEQIQEAVRNVAAKQSDSLSQLQLFQLNLSSEVTGLKQERKIANLVAAINSSDERQVDRLKQLQVIVEEVNNKVETYGSSSTQQRCQQNMDILNRVEQIKEAVRNVATKQSDNLSRLQMFQLNMSSEASELKQQQKNLLQNMTTVFNRIPDASRVLLQQHYGGTTFFCRTWNEFKVGFGDVIGNYWIGNDRLHQLTTYGQYKLRVDLQSKSNMQWYWAEYSTFRVDDELTGYRLNISGHSGTAGDSLTFVNGMKFSTRDRDNDVWGFHCASEVSQGNGGGFWYASCSYTCLNSPIDGQWGFVWCHLPTGDCLSNKLRVSRMTLIPIN